MAKKKVNTNPEKVTRTPTKSIPEIQYSLCVPSTIISTSNAINLQQITFIAYQIAKAATVYQVAEIVVLDIPSVEKRSEISEREANKTVSIGSKKTGQKLKFNFSDEEILNQENETISKEQKCIEDIDSLSEGNSLLFATLLQFFLTPPYLVKSVFANNKFNKKLKYARTLPKITTLPFMSNNNVFKDFKEGLTIPKHTPKIMKKNKKVSALKKLSVTKYVNIGESTPLILEGQEVPVNVRVTVDLKNKKIVSPVQAYGFMGNRSSFGYHVRICKKFSSIFTESSFPNGYTSTLYVNSDDYFNSNAKDTSRKSIAPFDKDIISSKGGKILLLFGNWIDISYSFDQDKKNLEGVEGAHQMFDGELLVAPGLKIEDATLVALTKVYNSTI